MALALRYNGTSRVTGRSSPGQRCAGMVRSRCFPEYHLDRAEIRLEQPATGTEHGIQGPPTLESEKQKKGQECGWSAECIGAERRYEVVPFISRDIPTSYITSRHLPKRNGNICTQKTFR